MSCCKKKKKKWNESSDSSGIVDVIQYRARTQFVTYDLLDNKKKQTPSAFDSTSSAILLVWGAEPTSTSTETSASPRRSMKGIRVFFFLPYELLGLISGFTLLQKHGTL